jgi:hypothetical protein
VILTSSTGRVDTTDPGVNVEEAVAVSGSSTASRRLAHLRRIDADHVMLANARVSGVSANAATG